LHSAHGCAESLLGSLPGPAPERNTGDAFRAMASSSARPASRGVLSAMKSGASHMKSSVMSSFQKVQKKAETLTDVDDLVAKLEDTYVSEEKKKRAELRGCHLSDFDVKATLGTGSFGRVRLVRHTKYGRVYALKMLSKAVVLRTKQVEHIMSEKRLLTDIAFPFIINLYGAFQDEKYLYLTLEYSIGGEFFTHLRRAGKFSNDTARFYASQVLRALLTSCAARTLVANTNVARMLRLQK